MSENKNAPAFPVTVKYDVNGNPIGYQNGTETGQEVGLTKRELIAAKALQGILASDSNTTEWFDAEKVAQKSVEYADKLLAELQKS